MRKLPSVCALGILCFALASSGSTAKGQEELKETYEAFAVALGTSNPPVLPPGVSTTLQINDTR